MLDAQSIGVLKRGGTKLSLITLGFASFQSRISFSLVSELQAVPSISYSQALAPIPAPRRPAPHQ